MKDQNKDQTLHFHFYGVSHLDTVPVHILWELLLLQIIFYEQDRNVLFSRYVSSIKSHLECIFIVQSHIQQ